MREARPIDTARQIRDAFCHGRSGERRVNGTSSPPGDRILVEISGGVADVRLNRPDKLNALDPGMFEALVATGERLARTAGLRVVVLSGAGRGFCSGLDKDTFASMASGRRDPALTDLTARTHGLANAPQQAALVWRDLPVPVIAAIHGVALGGGFQIALGADIRYVAPDARLSILEVKWGLVPDMGGIALMRELARGDVIRELTMTGRMFSGDRSAGLRLRDRRPRRSAGGRSGDRARNRGTQPRRGARDQAAAQPRERRRRGENSPRGVRRAGRADRLAQPDRGRSEPP